ncbi:MAG: hypothetical protein ACI8PB_002910 [Desulforhopalus sp.]|jgi:hypothetical protein
MSSEITSVVSFGESVSSSSALIVAEIDFDKHKDDDGNAQTTFLPGEAVYFLVHHDPTIKIVRVQSTDGGDVQRIGVVTRIKTVELSFDHPAHLLTLGYNPAGAASAKWYGRQSNLYLDGRDLQADLAPCLGDVSFPFVAVQYLHRPIDGLSLAAGESFPTDIKVEYTVDEK